MIPAPKVLKALLVLLVPRVLQARRVLLALRAM